MKVFHCGEDNQLNMVHSWKEMVIEDDYMFLIGEHLHENVEPHRRVDSICNFDGSRPSAAFVVESYKDEIRTDLVAKIVPKPDQLVVYTRRLRNTKEDPFIYVFQITEVEIGSHCMMRLVHHQRMGQQLPPLYKKLTKLIQHVRDEQLDTPYAPKAYAQHPYRVTDTCLFVRRGNQMVSLTRQGKTLVLSEQSLLHRRYMARGYLPSMILMRVGYAKGAGKLPGGEILCDGYSFEPVTKDDWMNDFTRIEKTFGTLTDLRYVSTVNGDTFLAFETPHGVLHALYKAGDSYGTLTVNKAQRNTLVRTVQPCYFQSLATVFV